MAYVEPRDRLAIPSSPVHQQRDQSGNDDQRKDRCGEANAWSGKIREAGKVVEQARGVSLLNIDDGLLFFYGGVLLLEVPYLMVHAKHVRAEMLNSNKARTFPTYFTRGRRRHDYGIDDNACSGVPCCVSC